MHRIVIVGGGHAAAQLCASLAEGGFDGQITLISQEGNLPYHRPPLSKAFLKTEDAPVQYLRPATFFEEAGIAVRLNTTVTAIDRAARSVTLDDGSTLPYDSLVLATGTRARRLPGLAPTLANLHYLRTADDAAALRNALHGVERVTVLGGGFIGLEIAATARALGKTTTVIEAAPRLLSRSVSPEIAEHLTRTLIESGVALHLGVQDASVVVEGDRVTGLRHASGTEPVELLVAGIGAEPETDLAEAAGLAIDNGIVVNGAMRTSDEHIYAVGDCVRFPYSPWQQPLRLESVQNANDQARCLAANLLGKPQIYTALPWFWSEQGSVRLQIAGLPPAETERRMRLGASPASFSILHFVNDTLVCVESINAPADHIAARRLIEAAPAIDPSVLADPAIPLKTHL